MTQSPTRCTLRTCLVHMYQPPSLHRRGQSVVVLTHSERWSTPVSGEGGKGTSLSSSPLLRSRPACLTLSEKQYSLVRDEMKERLPSSEVECMMSWPVLPPSRMASCIAVKSVSPTCLVKGALVTGNDLAAPTRGDCAALAGFDCVHLPPACPPDKRTRTDGRT